MLRNALVMTALLALLTACARSGQPAPAPAPSPPPAADSPASAVPAAQPAAGGSHPAAEPAPAPAAVGARRYELIREQSKASYVVTELLAGATVRNQAIGSTSQITGELHLDADGRIQPATFTVDLRSLASDRGARDNYIRTRGLESSRYPTATFALREMKGSLSLKAGAQESFELIGPMQVRTTERTVTWKVTSVVQDGLIRWHAVLETQLTDWGINPPVLLVPSVAEVDNPFRIEVILVFRPTAS
jgi:polyisoprenoid-binding protein YceI